MPNVFKSMKSTAIGVAEFFTPVLKESKFQETGVVTPDEFVIAGDHLVHTCPTWEWACGDECKTKSYLPKNKQYLITKNVPCLRRCKQIENYEVRENFVELDDGNEGWVETHHYDTSLLPLKKLEESIQILNAESQFKGTEDKYADNEAVDMDAFIESGLLDDDSASIYPEQKKENLPVDEILKTRTYDLHITYDKFYKTPRLWLYGYNENQVPLCVKEMYEDVSPDYAKKTVTMEFHPHIPGPSMASIHPCKHAVVMKKLIKMVTKGGKSLNVHMYLIIFLKFVQSVIPTIDYDYTQNIIL